MIEGAPMNPQRMKGLTLARGVFLSNGYQEVETARHPLHPEEMANTLMIFLKPGTMPVTTELTVRVASRERQPRGERVAVAPGATALHIDPTVWTTRDKLCPSKPHVGS